MYFLIENGAKINTFGRKDLTIIYEATFPMGVYPKRIYNIYIMYILLSLFNVISQRGY